MTSPVQHPARLYFLDWVRILAFFVLILYHVGMYYVTWDWHVKSPHAGTGAEPFMQLSSPWRIGLLFFIGGAGASLLLARQRPAAFLRRRSLRLLVPLLFGMLVIVPPQPYLEVVEKLGYADGYGAFMRLYLSGYGGFCREDCLTLPTWNHLWFVAYLWVYTVLLGACIGLLGPRFDALAASTFRLLRGWRIIAVPAALLAGARVLMVEHFPTTHALVDDWYNHAMCFIPFVLGALVARTPGFWVRLEPLRWPALGMALTGWAAMQVWQALPEGVLGAQAAILLRPVMYAVHALLAWSAMVAACGFARRHLNHDGPARRYLNEAVFPVYIVHQTLIVVMAHALQPVRMAPGLEALVLVALTATLSFALFEIVRRVRVLRALFGLAPQGVAAAPSLHRAGSCPGPVQQHTAG